MVARTSAGLDRNLAGVLVPKAVEAAVETNKARVVMDKAAARTAGAVGQTAGDTLVEKLAV
jgi:hypothetical protein